MKWLRLYNEALHDAKVQLLPGETFKVWVNLLLMASESSDRGTLPDLRQIAFTLRMTVGEAEQVVGALADAGLIDRADDGSLRPHAWDERQPESDDAARRMASRRKGPKRSEHVPNVPRTCSEHVPNMFGPEEIRGEETRGEETETVAGARTRGTQPNSPPSEAGPGKADLRAEEDRQDLEAARLARQEPGSVPWDDLKASFDPDDLPFVPPPSGFVAPPLPPPAVANDPGEVHEVIDLAESAVSGWGCHARNACRCRPAAWVREAVTVATDAQRSGQSVSRWKYVERILQRFDSQGGPDSALARTPRGRPARASPGPTSDAVKAKLAEALKDL